MGWGFTTQMSTSIGDYVRQILGLYWVVLLIGIPLILDILLEFVFGGKQIVAAMTAPRLAMQPKWKTPGEWAGRFQFGGTTNYVSSGDIGELYEAGWAPVGDVVATQHYAMLDENQQEVAGFNLQILGDRGEFADQLRRTSANRAEARASSGGKRK